MPNSKNTDQSKSTNQFDASNFVGEFARFMELVHKQYGFSKLQIGILSAIMITPSPLTQEEIMLIFQENRSGVSIILNQLVQLQLIQIQKKTGDRKKYYTTSHTYRTYIAQFIQKVIRSYEMNLNWIESLITTCSKIESDPDMTTFRCFLTYFQQLHKLFLNFLVKIPNTLSDVKIESNYLPLSTSQEKQLFDDVESQRNVFSILLQKKTLEFSENKIISPNSNPINSPEVWNLKRKMIQLIESISSGAGTQKEFATILLLLFSEFTPITQEYICELTQYSRSIVSETLSNLMNMGFIILSKHEHDRKKYYSPKFSLDQFVGIKFDMMEKYGSTIISGLRHFQDTLNRMNLEKQIIFMQNILKNAIESYQSFNNFINKIKKEYFLHFLEYK